MATNFANDTNHNGNKAKSVNGLTDSAGVPTVGGGGSSTINPQTANYTLVTGDNGAIVEMNSATAKTITVPTGLASGFSCQIVQIGAGIVTIAAGAGMTIRNRATQYRTSGQYAVAGLYVRASTTEFIVVGDTQV